MDMRIGHRLSSLAACYTLCSEVDDNDRRIVMGSLILSHNDIRKRTRQCYSMRLPYLARGEASWSAVFVNDVA
eukprot:scaffold50078_cov51-Attheya_sp.AAC.5